MIGSIVGGAMKIGSAIFGGIKQAKAAKNVQENLRNQMKENQEWYDRRYNEDATQRADAQRLITMTEESIRNRNRQAAGTQAVMGGTNESVAAAKQANNAALSDTMSQISAAAGQRKDAIEQQYQQRKDSLNQQLAEVEMQKAKNISDAVAGAASAARDITGLKELDATPSDSEIKKQEPIGIALPAVTDIRMN